MARKLNKDVISKRIKDNKAVMKANKPFITKGLAAAIKGDDFDVNDVGNMRQAFSTFIKAAVAVKADSVKLALISE